MYAHTQPVFEPYYVQSECSWGDQAVACIDMPAQSPDSDLTYSDSLTPSGTESYIHPYPDFTYNFSCSYPMLDELTGSPYTSTLDFTPPCVALDLSAEIAEPSVGYTTDLISQGELGMSGEGVYYPIEYHTFPALWNSQYAEQLSPGLTPTVPAVDSQLEDACATNPIIYTSSPSDTDTFPVDATFLSSVNGSSNESFLELDGLPDWNLDAAWMNQFLQTNTSLEGGQQTTFLSYPTTASLTIETTLRVSPVACRCGGNYLPAMNDYQQKSLEYY